MKRQRLTKEQLDQIIRLSKENMSQDDIAKTIGTSQPNVSKIIRRYREQTDTQNEKWSKPLNQCQPREIFAYLKTLGYGGDLIYTKRIRL